MYRSALYTLLAALLSSAFRGDGAGDAQALWTRSIQPLLDVQCVKCHGPLEHKGGLVLDDLQGVLKGGEEGAVLVPGKPSESKIYRYLAPDSDPHMPPKKQLTEAQREEVKAWILAMGNAKPSTGKPSQGTEKASVPRRFDSIEKAIDTCIAESWKQNKVKPAPAAEDTVWCRRVYLDLIGRIPTSAELAAFQHDSHSHKRAALVDRLLASNEYSAHMRELWDVLLMGRPKRDNQEDRRKDGGWWKFLEASFAKDRPWNETVRAMLVARPQKPEDQGAGWFLYERRNDHQAIAEAVAPVIYGTKINCAQCHDHPLAREIKQAHYWGLVTAFNRSKNIDGTNAVAESAVGGHVNFTNLKKESQPAIMTLLSGSTVTETRPAATETTEKDDDANYIDPKAKVRIPKYSRRETFALAATQNNPLLAKAFVNRMWSVLLGRGLIHPADEMNARNPCSHPELLEWLSQDFANHGYEARHLIRGIVLSRVYGLSRSDAHPPETFAGALERPMSAEPLARSWRVALGLTPEDDALRRKTVSAIPDVLPKEYNATFQQALFLTRSPALNELLKVSPGGLMEKTLALPNPKAQVKQVFEAIYGRSPDAEETREAVGFLTSDAKGTSEERLRDLVWALMTSAEFLTMP